MEKKKSDVPKKDKTKRVMLTLPPDVYERWERIRKIEAPLTPMANFLAEKTRIGIESKGGVTETKGQAVN